MPTCPACGQERKEIEPIVSTWKTVDIEGGIKKYWGLQPPSKHEGALYDSLAIPGRFLNARDYPFGTVVTIRAEFQLP